MSLFSEKSRFRPKPDFIDTFSRFRTPSPAPFLGLFPKKEIVFFYYSANAPITLQMRHAAVLFQFVLFESFSKVCLPTVKPGLVKSLVKRKFALLRLCA